MDECSSLRGICPQPKASVDASVCTAKEVQQKAGGERTSSLQGSEASQYCPTSQVTRGQGRRGGTDPERGRPLSTRSSETVRAIAGAVTPPLAADDLPTTVERLRRPVDMAKSGQCERDEGRALQAGFAANSRRLLASASCLVGESLPASLHKIITLYWKRTLSILARKLHPLPSSLARRGAKQSLLPSFDKLTRPVELKRVSIRDGQCSAPTAAAHSLHQTAPKRTLGEGWLEIASEGAMLHGTESFCTLLRLWRCTVKLPSFAMQSRLSLARQSESRKRKLPYEEAIRGIKGDIYI